MSDVTFKVGDWLALAAAPTCFAMAFASVITGEGMAPLMQSHGSPLGGMAVMYCLMGAFHSPAWLRLIGRVRSSERRIAHA